MVLCSVFCDHILPHDVSLRTICEWMAMASLRINSSIVSPQLAQSPEAWRFDTEAINVMSNREHDKVYEHNTPPKDVERNSMIAG